MTDLVQTYSYNTVLSDELNNVASINDLSITGALSMENNAVLTSSLSGVAAMLNSLTVADTSSFTGEAVFLSPPTMSGAGITHSTIPVEAIAAPSQTTLTLGAGHVEVDLHGSPANEFVLNLTGPLHTLTFLNASLGALFSVFVTNQSGAPQIVHKQLNTVGGTPSYNTLSGDTSFSSGSFWAIKGKCVSPSVILLDFINYT